MIITSEQVSFGHPDKICDQIADAILVDCLRNDPSSRVAVECLIKDNHVVLGGEITSTHNPDYYILVSKVLTSVGISDFMLTNYIGLQSNDIGQGVDDGGAGDQGIMFGYACNETKELLPLPYVLATKALKYLMDLKHPQLLFDAKSQVSYDYDLKKIDTFLISCQHSESLHLDDLRKIVIEIMFKVANEYHLNTDFRILINPTGRFVSGGSFADCGVTGRKIIADTYGGFGAHGGGAFSGKDPSKVDRSGAYMARKIARDLVISKECDKCLVQIAYAIGVKEPVSIALDCYGTNHRDLNELILMIEKKYDLKPQSIIKSLNLLDVDYRLTSTYGHFMNSDFPWEN